MGQPMPNHHSTSVESGPTTRGPVNGAVEDGASLTDLISQKKNLEAELSALSSVLDSVSSMPLIHKRRIANCMRSSSMA